MAAKTTKKKAGATVTAGDDFSAKFAQFQQDLTSHAAAQRGVTEDLVNMNIDVIPTGMLGLDIATGVGGLPLGRIVELYGMESCGKSTTLYHVIANAQKMGIIPVMIESEGSCDIRYMRRIGVDVSNMIFWTPDSQEAAIDMIIAAANLAKSMDQRALIMLDSVAAMAPEVMMESSADQKFRATQASVWSAQMPRMIRAVREAKACLVLVNQMREPMDMYKPASTPGGKAIKFAASQRILMRRTIEKPGKEELDGSTGQVIQFLVEKNKVSSPMRRGFAFLPAGRRVNLVDDVIGRGIERGIIQKDVKFSGDELEPKKGWFTIDPDTDMLFAISEDLKRAEEAHALDKLPSAGGAPILNIDAPISVYRESVLRDVLDAAPAFTQALAKAIVHTLVIERENIDDVDPFEAMLAEASAAFDAEAADKLTTEEARAALEAAEAASADDEARFKAMIAEADAQAAAAAGAADDDSRDDADEFND